jgi:hydrogenase expression/formation protein HypE
MDTGKISNAVLKRSVLKIIKKRNNGYASKPKIGSDFAEIQPREGSKIITAVSCGPWPVNRIANNIAVAGGTAVAVQCCIVMPKHFDERVLKNIMHSLEAECDQYNIQISGGHTQVSQDVLKPVVTVTGIGMCDSKLDIRSSNAKPGQDVIMSKWIGIGGIRKIIEQKKEDILKVYSEDLITKAFGAQEDMSVAREAQIAAKCGVTCMHDVADGGIFAALWDLSEAANVGLEIDFKSISVKQEIIEICEMFDVNPYELESSGCLLMTADRGYDIVTLLEQQGIKAKIIGKTTQGNAKIIQNQDEIRYLDTPKVDEIYRFI